MCLQARTCRLNVLDHKETGTRTQHSDGSHSGPHVVLQTCPHSLGLQNIQFGLNSTQEAVVETTTSLLVKTTQRRSSAHYQHQQEEGGGGGGCEEDVLLFNSLNFNSNCSVDEQI